MLDAFALTHARSLPALIAARPHAIFGRTAIAVPTQRPA
ncbi:hypothetical protein XHC_0841 [Xanthomonas hortorum pv. carotae str. M081]|nr:hypothetical protein XHC_0841 [Xanthomonas hortorum pv. carotae str. M081]